MQFARMFVLLAVGGGLWGCANTPGDLDAKPIYRVITLDQEVEDVYYRLTAEAPRGSRCEERVSADYYPGRGEFRIYYGRIVGFSQGGILDSLVGRSRDGKTILEFRKNSSAFGNDTYSDWVAAYLETGKCD